MERYKSSCYSKTFFIYKELLIFSCSLIVIIFVLSIGATKISAQSLQPMVDLSPGQRTSGGHQTYIYNGIIYVVWGHEGTIFLRRSLDSGYSWQPVQTLGIGINFNMGFSGDYVYYVYAEANQKTGLRTIKFRRSLDRGNTFEPVEILDIPTEIRNCNPQVVANQNKVLVVWGDCGFSPTGPLYRRSVDFGQTFQSTQILPYRGQAQISTSGDFVYLIYFSHSQNVSHFLRSVDFGSTFQSPLFLTSGAVNSDAQIISNANSVYAVYPCAPPGICLRRSDDFGATLRPEINLSDNSLHPSLPRVAVSGDNIVIAYTDDAPGLTNVFLTTSTNGGISFSPIRNLSNTASSANYVRVNIYKNFIYVGWQERLNIGFPGSTSAVYISSTDNGNSFSPKRVIFDYGLSPEINLINFVPIITSNNLVNGGVYFRRSRPLPLSPFGASKYFRGRSQ